MSKNYSKSLDPATTPYCALHFSGHTYVTARDQQRLTTQVNRVYNLMADGVWRTIPEIAQHIIGTETALSAALRKLRSRQCGEHTVERLNLDGGGLWAYRLIINPAALTITTEYESEHDHA